MSKGGAFNPYTGSDALKSGDLFEACALQNKVVAVSASGNRTESYQTVESPVWIRIIPLYGQALFWAGQLSNEIEAQLRLRYRTDIVIGTRFVTRLATYEALKPPVDMKQTHNSLVVYVKSMNPVNL